MIQVTPTILQPKSWQQELATAITDPAELLKVLNLPDTLLPAARQASQLFALKVPLAYCQRIRQGDVNDPLLRQILPLGLELETVAGYSADPVGDHAAMESPGLLQKYQGRALLLTTGACAVHCRYCFRREFPYTEANPARNDWQQALSYLTEATDINEIILSGGDPLTLSDERLNSLIQALEAIPHLQRLRIHSRLPVVLPNRITDELCSTLAQSRFQTVMVLHSNHANEIDDTVAEACQQLASSGTALLNQSVLLAGINDSAEQLITLSERLFAVGVLPYYLHQLDKVSGGAHFSVADSVAKQLLIDIQAKLSGYLVPKLVRESAGANSKLPL